jgi:DNA replication protein DnaC
VRRDLPIEDPDFGKAVACRCAREESAEVRADRLQRYSNLGPLAGVTFDSLLAARSARFGAARAAAERAAREEGDWPWLLITGPAGAGKTSLGAAIANDRIGRGRAALYVVLPDLLDHLRAAYRKDADVPYPQLFEQVRTAPFLVLDDLDAANPTDWAGEKIFQIANHRMTARLPTVLLASAEPGGALRRALPMLDRDDLVERHDLGGPAGAADAGAGTYREIGGFSRDQLDRHTFERFRLEGHLSAREVEKLKHVRDMVRQWAARPDGWLVLTGPTGTGKTHLAAAAARERLAAGDSVFFAVVPDLLDYLRRAYRPDNAETYDDVLDALRAAGLLILDDLGAHSTTPWAEEKLYQLFSYRYLQESPTLITTNVDQEDLDPRLVSRMLDTRRKNLGELDVRDHRTGKPPRPVAPRSGTRRRAGRRNLTA